MTQTNTLIARPLLTIAIPTFNRAICLRESLSSLFDQLIAQPNVELIISDNASTDETSTVVEEFEKRGLRLRYLRNQINVGPDANFIQCLEQARGKYMWLLSDDDVVVSGGLGKILTLLAEADYALVYVRAYAFHKDYLAERPLERFQGLAQAIPNGLPFIRRVGTTIAFISAIIVNRDRYSFAERPRLNSLIGSDLIHLGWLLPVLGGGGTSLIVWERLVAGRVTLPRGWEICQVFGDNLMELLSTVLPDKKDITSSIINRALRSWFPCAIMLQMRRSTMSIQSRKSLCRSLESLHKGNWRYWVYVFPVATFPYWAARAWYAATQLLDLVGRLSMVALSYPRWRKDLIWGSR